MFAGSAPEALAQKNGGVLKVGNLGEPPTLDAHCASGRVPGHRSGYALPGVTTAARRSTSCKDVGGRFRSAVPSALSCPSVGHQK